MYCENQGLSIIGDYPVYNIQKNSIKILVKIIEPFVLAEVNDKKITKKAIPKVIVQEIFKEISKLEKLSTETDLNRFAEITCLCDKILLDFEPNPQKIVKIKNLLQVVKRIYSSQGLNVDEFDLLNKVINKELFRPSCYGKGPFRLIGFQYAKR